MTSFRKLLLVAVSAAALCAIEACSSGTELNPQPLPPESNGPTPPTDDQGKGSSSGSAGTNPPGSADASAGGSGDASDAGEQ